MPAAVGRDRELGVAEAFLDELSRGPAGLVFRGEPGIGKSTLLDACLQSARGRGFRILVARPVEAEVALAFSALADLLEPVADAVLPELPEPQRRALSIALLREEPGSVASDRRAVAVATLSSLRVLGRRGPVVVAVDDLQFLDPSSEAALRFAARRLGGLPIGIVTCAGDGAFRADALMERALPEGAVTRVALEPFEAETLREIIAMRLDVSYPPATLERIHAASGGNPFFALEIARSLAGARRSEWPGAWVPERLRQMIESRIGTLPGAVRGILLAAASVATPTVGVLAEATGLPESRIIRVLDGAATAGIVGISAGQVRFSHPIFSAAIEGAATDAERRRTHRRLADLVPGVEDRARHLGLSAVSPDAAIASRLEDAARHALRRGAPEVAAQLAESALRLTPVEDADDRLRRAVSAAEYRFHAGDLDGARALLERELTDAAPGATRATGMRLLGEIEFHANRMDHGARIFSEALAESGGEPRIVAEIEARLAFAAVHMGDFAGGLEHARLARDRASAIDDASVEAEALAVAAMAQFLEGDGLDEESLARAIRLEDIHGESLVEMRPSLIAGSLALYVGEVDRAIEILTALRERVLQRGEEADVVGASFSLIWAECWRGDLAAAAAHAEEAVAAATAIDSSVLQVTATAGVALASGWLGDVAATQARAEHARAMADRTGNYLATQWSQWAVAVCALAHDEPGVAAEALADLAGGVEGGPVAEPIRAPWVPDAAEALVGLGELDRAERLLDVFDAAGLRHGRGWALAAGGRSRALLLAARGRLDEAAEVAGAALRRAEAGELRLDVGRALLVVGQLERRRRHRRAAQEALERARALFADAGAAAWANRAAVELRRIGLRRGVPDELTPSERRVAELAATGLTNREVAAAMFISPKTVEANLARAYAKLGIRSRAELGARIGREPIE